MNIEILLQAQRCWLALARYRRERERNKRYHYGDQWGDTIQVDGRPITEEEWIRSQGSEPLKNNLIRRLVRNVIGVYCAQSGDTRCSVRDAAEEDLGRLMTTLLKYNNELNRLSALYTRTLEEFLIGGLVVHRKWYGTRNGRTDCWTDYVAPNAFFVDSDMRDFRCWDCSMVGMVHDVTIEGLCQQFAQSADDCKRLRDIYSQRLDPAALSADWQDFGYSDGPSRDFLAPARQGMCRVIEVWRRETQGEYLCHDMANGTLYVASTADYDRLVVPENAKRQAQGRPLIMNKWRMREVWRYYYLSPWGNVLKSGDSPYAHGSHPFVMKAYPMIDGEIHAFVSDVIDQQRYTNRLITLYDWIVRSSAKGVLLVPEDCIPRGCTPSQFADTWSRFNGVLLYHPSLNGDIPKQVASNSTNVGITELLNLQMKLFEDISGVHGALEGKLTNGAVSGTLFNAQTQNATTALMDVLGTFNEFVRDAAYKDVRNMQQFYGPEQIQAIAGAEAAKTIKTGFDDAEFDLSITPANTTASSREASNRLLMEIWRSGQITLEQMLEAGDFPFKLTL